MLSRALLIARVAFFFFQRFSSVPRGQPGSIVGDAGHSAAFRMVRSSGPLRTLPAVYVSAVIDGGSHPFPFRTRKLSLLSPMVLGLRARESRSLQDSRPACRKRRAGLFLCPRCHARAGGHLPPGPEPVTGRPRRTRGWRATACEPGGGLPLTQKY